MNSAALFQRITGVSPLVAGIDTMAKATIVLLMATVLTALLRRASSAARHRIWCLAFAGLLALPLVSAVAPTWQIGILPAHSESTIASTDWQRILAGASDTGFANGAVADQATLNTGRADGRMTPAASAAAEPMFDARPIGFASGSIAILGELALFAWMGGIVVFLLPLAVGHLHNRRLKASGQQLVGPDWQDAVKVARKTLNLRRVPKLFVVECEIIPLTWGLAKPIVLLPASCHLWSETRRRHVLLHELAHIQRLDLPLQVLARIAYAVYWFHPLAWYGLHRLRLEREQACDDAVIATGERASDYASQLIAIAEAYDAPRLGMAVTMARRSQLESRLKAMFNCTASHRPLSRSMSWSLMMCAAMLVLVMAALQPVAPTVEAEEAQAPARPAPEQQTKSEEASSDAAKIDGEEGPEGEDPTDAQPEVLADEQIDAITLRHLKALMWAVHVYSEHHQWQLPPAAVPNPTLPPEKRLSGFVLLLPYLGIRPDYISEDDAAWNEWHADNEAAKRLFQKIDLTRAWDDPANSEAAKTMVPEFVTPSGAKLRDEQGYALSHFAFVRGSAGADNGAFPLIAAEELSIMDITDGTVSTLAMGQIHENLGPWIAAGPSTARFVGHPSAEVDQPTFGSQFEGAAYFANGDGFTYFLDMARTDQRVLAWLAERADGHKVGANDYFRYSTAAEWKRDVRGSQGSD